MEETEITSTSELEDLKKKLKETEDSRLLTLADMDNLRKRFLKEAEQLKLNTIQDTVNPFLQVFDYFKLAVKAAEKTDNLESLKQGMKMIYELFNKALSELSVEQIEALGKPFDPNFHDAKEYIPSETVKEGIVIEQQSTGYKINNRLLKPAVVIVSSGKK